MTPHHSTHHRTGQQVLAEEQLALRAKILEIAAGLDRIDRASGPPPQGEPVETIHRAIETLLRPGGTRAEEIQLLFSRPFEDDWRSRFEL